MRAYDNEPPTGPARIIPKERAQWRGRTPMPWCATCRSEVDEIAWYGMQRCVVQSWGGVSGILVMEYRCHGSSEIYAVPEKQLIESPQPPFHRGACATVPRGFPLVAFLPTGRLQYHGADLDIPEDL